MVLYFNNHAASHALKCIYSRANKQTSKQTNTSSNRGATATTTKKKTKKAFDENPPHHNYSCVSCVLWPTSSWSSRRR